MKPKYHVAFYEDRKEACGTDSVLNVTKRQVKNYLTIARDYKERIKAIHNYTECELRYGTYSDYRVIVKAANFF